MLTSVAQAVSALPAPLQCGQISSCVLGNSLFLLTSNPSTGGFFVLGNNSHFIVVNARLQGKVIIILPQFLVPFLSPSLSVAPWSSIESHSIDV